MVPSLESGRISCQGQVAGVSAVLSSSPLVLPMLSYWVYVSIMGRVLVLDSVLDRNRNTPPFQFICFFYS